MFGPFCGLLGGKVLTCAKRGFVKLDRSMGRGVSSLEKLSADQCWTLLWLCLSMHSFVPGSVKARDFLFLKFSFSQLKTQTNASLKHFEV